MRDLQRDNNRNERLAERPSVRIKRININRKYSFPPIDASKKDSDIPSEWYVYSIRKFFRDIKRTIHSIKRKSVNYRQISVDFLKRKSKWYVNDLILRSKKDPHYFLSTQVLNSYEKTLKLKIGKNFNKLREYFEKYRSIYSGQYKTENPNLIDDYFETIDTTEKAYWYGWLLAEGNIRLHRRKYSLTLEIGVQDGIFIKRFIYTVGISPKKVLYIRRPPNKFNKDYHGTFSFSISGNYFARHLHDHGYPTGKKSHLIRFPIFIDNKLSMACLLGFFDGDGTHSGGTARIGTIKSKKFLEDIIREFGLDIEPRKHISNGELIGYYLPLEGQFFNELLINYKESLPRKRIIYKDPIKFQFSKEELQEMFMENSLISAREIAEKHYEVFGIRVTEATVYLYLRNVERLSKDEYYRLKTIELLGRGQSLRNIFKKEFNLKNYDIYGKKFFRRIFKEDSLVKGQNLYGKNIFKVIEEIYGSKRVLE